METDRADQLPSCESFGEVIAQSLADTMRLRQLSRTRARGRGW